MTVRKQHADVNIILRHRVSKFSDRQPHVTRFTRFVRRVLQITQARFAQAIHAVKMSHMPFQMTSGHLNQPLQKSTLHPAFVR